MQEIPFRERVFTPWWDHPWQEPAYGKKEQINKYGSWYFRYSNQFGGERGVAALWQRAGRLFFSGSRGIHALIPNRECVMYRGVSQATQGCL